MLFPEKLNLPKLEHLEISGFRGKEINIEFDKLESLNSLAIRGCPNLYRTSKITGKQLKSITLNHNPKLKSLNIDSTKLKKLEEFILEANDSLYNVPQKIGNITVTKY